MKYGLAEIVEGNGDRAQKQVEGKQNYTYQQNDDGNENVAMSFSLLHQPKNRPKLRILLIDFVPIFDKNNS